MIVTETKVAVKSFSLAIFLLSFVSIFHLYFEISSLTSYMVSCSSVLLVLYALLRLQFQGFNYQIAIRAAILGTVFAIGIHVRLVAPPHIQIFGGYMCVMAFFHFSEFTAISIVQPKQVSIDSFVINHSPQYIAAAVMSWVEFFIEAYFCPGLKQLYWVSNAGLVLCILGEVWRKTAMITAGSSFNHLVQHERSSDHVLVTHGIYSWCRHPSYVGWFYWSIGTQILLLNPLCVPAYAIVSWMFFKSRIYIEEITLLNFFGQSYCDYQLKVGTGIPLIEGYKI
ncbi:unnamed protein product [Phaedon cochleariae]|uniref:Protein-S-isoprenylcysteine O-methyltransferase n=1 Tax=Phaedon cochleariae TaxID=80249 RepID=A0A9N9S9M1_PHACE|nr:unnamed protein product [Phaedon cochleariae]